MGALLSDPAAAGVLRTSAAVPVDAGFAVAWVPLGRAGVAELVDALDSKSGALTGRVGSNPTFGTTR